MKSQRGITLISLTIYIIAMTIVIAIISVISSYFYTNIDATSKNIDPLTEYTKFNTFFSEEINHKNIKVLECGEENDYIIFDNGIQYTFIKENKGIYRNKVKICRKVQECTFEYEKKEGRDIIIVNITMENSRLRHMEYTLKN